MNALNNLSRLVLADYPGALLLAIAALPIGFVWMTAWVGFRIKRLNKNVAEIKQLIADLGEHIDNKIDAAIARIDNTDASKAH